MNKNNYNSSVSLCHSSTSTFRDFGNKGKIEGKMVPLKGIRGFHKLNDSLPYGIGLGRHAGAFPLWLEPGSGIEPIKPRVP